MLNRAIVELRQLSYVYPDDCSALRNISFAIHVGESVALIGANGAGKSTLLQHLTGCLLATSGQVCIGELLVCGKNLKMLRRKVGMIFQHPDDQLFMPTVFEDVAFGLIHLGLTKSELEERVMASLASVGATHLASRPPHRLSQGEKRAVAIAGVLTMKTELLVMDEPTSGLDPRSRRRLSELLISLRQTQIIATHDLDFALKVCPRTIILHHGQVLADGPTEEILRDEALLERSGLR